MYELAVRSGFSAAHRLIGYDGACQQIHGHNWKVFATIASEKLDELGMVVDLYKLEKLLNDCLCQFDHKIINDTKPFDTLNPTSENLAKYIYDCMAKGLPDHVKMVKVQLLETDNFSVTYHG